VLSIGFNPYYDNKEKTLVYSYGWIFLFRKSIFLKNLRKIFMGAILILRFMGLLDVSQTLKNLVYQ